MEKPIPIKYKHDPQFKDYKFPETLPVKPSVGDYVLARSGDDRNAQAFEFRVTRITLTTLSVYLTVVKDD